MQTQDGKTITLKIPRHVDEKAIREEVERMIERRYGYVKIETVRKRLGIKKLKKNVHTEGDEEVLKAMREKGKKRVMSA